MNLTLRLFVQLLVVLPFAAVGCAQRPPLQPSLRVVDRAVVAQDAGTCRGSRGEVGRLYRLQDQWCVRREATREVTPRARQLLATGSEPLAEATHHPAPLPQEWLEEQARLRALIADNRQAMQRLDEASETLAQAAQALLKRTEKLAEPSPVAKKPPEPLP